MQVFWYYVALFTLYSIIGWAIDALYTRFYEGRWAKRGFHHGPFYMLYGWGALASIMLFDEHSPLLLLIPVAALYSSIIEYTGSLVMERIGLSYWDYSKNWLNLHGRICFQSISIFVVSIIGVIYGLQPLLRGWVLGWPEWLMQGIGIVSFLYLFIWGIVRVRIQYAYYKKHKKIRHQAYDIAE